MINESAQRLALDVIHGKILEQPIRDAAAACEKRREESKLVPHRHYCASYVHCMIDFSAGYPMPVCPISIRNELDWIKYRCVHETPPKDN